MPAVNEPFGLAVLEAVQARLPVVISKQTGILEYINTPYQADYYEKEVFTLMVEELLYDSAKRNKIITWQTRKLQSLLKSTQNSDTLKEVLDYVIKP